MIIDVHSTAYLLLALAYCEGMITYAVYRKWHPACREFLIALLYVLVFLHPVAVPVAPNVGTSTEHTLFASTSAACNANESAYR